jgi:type II secretory pathway pseudopilin PulG
VDTSQVHAATRNKRARAERKGARASRASCCRKGFTIVELLIALVLLDVGLLALVGLAASVDRDADSVRTRTNALNAASGRLETMASHACQGGGSGVAQVSPGITEWFAEAPAPNATRGIVDSVAYATPHGVRTFVLRTAARC